MFRRRWKGEGTRILRTKTGGKYKLFWKGCSEGVSGVGVIVSEEFIDKVVVEVTRVSERLMMVKLIVGKCLMNVVAAYAPQTGRSQDDDVVLRHTLPVFTGLGRCPIVNWDFCWSSEHYWTGCPSTNDFYQD